jgi:hypothetical protein
MGIRSYKQVNEKIMILFAKTLVGCDFDMGQDANYMVQKVKRWLRENDLKVEKIIKETTGEKTMKKKTVTWFYMKYVNEEDFKPAMLIKRLDLKGNVLIKLFLLEEELMRAGIFALSPFRITPESRTLMYDYFNENGTEFQETDIIPIQGKFTWVGFNVDVKE